MRRFLAVLPVVALLTGMQVAAPAAAARKKLLLESMRFLTVSMTQASHMIFPSRSMR